MPAYRQIDGVYEWEVSLPPASVAALMSAVCVDLGSANPQLLGNVLWGPKSWTIRFDGLNFELRPLGRGNLYMFWGFEHGTIVPTKSGSCILLRPKPRSPASNVLLMMPILIAIVLGPTIIMQILWNYSIGISILAAFGIIAWLAWMALAFYWLVPWTVRTSYTDFIDDLFADYIVFPPSGKSLAA